MPYLPVSLESILRQPCSDFEIVIIDDGSTDGSWKYLRTVRDRRLHLMSQPHQGLSATLNRMLSEINTPWLVRHDADDVAYPNRLARTIEFIRRYPETGMFYSFADYHPHGSVGTFRTTKGTPDDIRKLVLSGYLPAICHPTATLNVEKVMRVGGYRFNLHVEDIDLWWRMALDSELRLIPEVTVGVRHNVKSISFTNFANQAINTLYVQYLLLSCLWNLTPLPYEEARVALAQLFDRRKLAFKTHIRTFNIELGQGDHGNALRELGRACLASPIDFWRRLLDEMFGHRGISVGEPPRNFRTIQNMLWPLASRARLNPEATASFNLSLPRRETKV